MLRALLRHPGSSLAAAAIVATGSGAVVAMFSIYAAAILHPMDIESPEGLVSVIAVNPKVNTVPTALSWIRFDNSLRHAQSFSHIAAWDFDSASLTIPGQPPAQLSALRVSSDFFPALGVVPAVGRVFTPDDDRPNGPAVCLLSHELWVTRFGSRPLIGETIELNGRPVEVIGVLPPRVTAPWTSQELFLPRLFETSTMAPDNIRNGSSYLAVLARLKPGYSIGQAQAELDGLAAAYASEFAGRLDAANHTRVQPFVESLVSSQRQSLLVLLAAVGAVLLVACANASTLFLGRLLARQREIAVRRALGASRARIVWQLLAESLTLSTVAGAAGLGIAWALLRSVDVWLGASLAQGAAPALDVEAFGLASLVVLASAVFVGLAPALYVTRPAAAPLVTFARGESSSASGRRLRSLLVLSEVALSCVLLIGAALLIASFVRLQRASPGFETQGVASGYITLPPERYGSPDRQAAFAIGAVERLRAEPGVRNAAAIFGLPLGQEFSFHQYVIGGRPIPPPSERERAGIRMVTEGYFDVMQIRLQRGRVFTEHDRAGAPLVCVINASLARRMFDGNPIGQTIRRGRDADLNYEIVGIVDDVHTYGLRRPPVDEVYYPLRQLPWAQLAIVARSDGDPALLRRTMEGAVASVDPGQPVAGFATMEQRLDRSWGAERAMASTALAFAAIGLLLALVGVYAVLAQSVASRTAEIGVRVALGADRGQIVRLILSNGMTIVGVGIAIGVLAAMLGGGYLSAQLYAVDSRDPWIIAGTAGLFATVALAACLAPSWQAARLDPVHALRRI
jgi:putative ABC transport system permease protein